MERTSHSGKTNQQGIYEGSFLKNAAKNTKEFFKNKFKDIKKSAKAIVKNFTKKYGSSKKRSNFKPGKMLQFNYRAKDANKRYDKNPLIIVLGPPKNKQLRHTHVLGLNLHWLPMKSRVSVASFFVELNKKRNNQLRYDDIKPFVNKFAGHPVLRMYIIQNISQKVVELPEDMFMTAASVPSERWSS